MQEDVVGDFADAAFKLNVSPSPFLVLSPAAPAVVALLLRAPELGE